MNPLILARRADLEIINIKKKKEHGFCSFNRAQSENKREPKDKQILGPFQRTKKTMEYESDSGTNCF